MVSLAGTVSVEICSSGTTLIESCHWICLYTVWK